MFEQAKVPFLPYILFDFLGLKAIPSQQFFAS
jgi:hypothetical protein